MSSRVDGVPASTLARARRQPRASGLRLRTIAIHAALIGAAVIVLFPFLWITAAAFKTQIALRMGQVAVTPTLANFRELQFSITSD